MQQSRDIVTALLLQGKTVSTVVHGNSMHPAIRSGESVMIAPLQPNDLRPGSIVLFTYAQRLVLHRLIACNPRTATCRLAGDMSHSGTECIPVANCTGIAVALLSQGTTRNLYTRRARYLGLALFYARPLRRLIARLWFHNRNRE